MLDFQSCIQSTDTLPSRFRLEAYLKQKADVAAALVRPHNADWADRIEQCSDRLKVITFSNGYRHLANDKYCRVRACPLCRRAKAQRDSAISHRAWCQSKEMGGKHWFFVALPCPPVPVAEARSALKHYRHEFGNLIHHKLPPQVGYIRTTNLRVDPEGLLHCQFYYWRCVRASGMGREYISQARMSQLWCDRLGQDVPLVVQKRFTERGRLPKDVYWSSFNFADVESVPSDHLGTFLRVTHKHKAINFSMSFGEEDCNTTTPKSRAANRDDCFTYEVDNFCWMPNPDDEEHQNAFLHVPDIALMLNGAETHDGI